jgi:ketosteroid isomerase-like protein
MSTAANKQLMQHIFDELAKGNGQPFLESLTDDFRWTITGSSAWSRTFEGKQAVRTQLLDPLFEQFADRYTNRAHRFIAEDDLVVVECRGKVNTKSGQPYNNAYCWIFRIEGGKLKELTEYLDSHLTMSVLKPPIAA